tara:strand:- start:10232 stop:10813 length:582 start_codon:yes stop_codon:yes gene_type:complete
MTIQKDFGYYHQLCDTITHSLLHLLCKVSEQQRFVPVSRRNEILVKYLKPKLNNKQFSSVKKDIKLMIQTARAKGSNLEEKLYLLNEKAKETKIGGLEPLYSLLDYLSDKQGLDSELYRSDATMESDVLYLSEEHLKQDDTSTTSRPAVSIYTRSEQITRIVDDIQRHGSYTAEMKDWNEKTNQAHILLHCAT